MGVKGFCRSANRGGTPLLYRLFAPSLSSLSGLLSTSPASKKQEFEYILVRLGVLSGIWETLKRENQTNIKFWCDFMFCDGLFCVAFGAPILLFWLVVLCAQPSIRAKTDKNKLF